MTDEQAFICTLLALYGIFVTLLAVRLVKKCYVLTEDVRRLLFEPGYYEKVQADWREFERKCKSPRN